MTLSEAQLWQDGNVASLERICIIHSAEMEQKLWNWSFILSRVYYLKIFAADCKYWARMCESSKVTSFVISELLLAILHH